MLQTGKIVSVIFNDANYEDKVELNLGDYEIIEEHGKAYAVKKKPKYPKTYEECAKVLLDRASVRNDFGYKGDLLVALQKLLVCRDAYWKIAGEEMGLGKPWEPDWGNEDETKWVIFNLQNKINLLQEMLLMQFSLSQPKKCEMLSKRTLTQILNFVRSCCNMEKITILANRLAESILMDWGKEEQIKLAKEVAVECNKIVTEFHKEQGVVCKESLQTQTLE